jgi:hypothetical protein
MISKRHAFASLAALVLSLNLACTPKVQSKPEPIQAAVAFDTQQTMAELMLWVIDPAADTIWDSVSWISNEKGTKHQGQGVVRENRVEVARERFVYKLARD